MYLHCGAKRGGWGESYQLLRCVPDDHDDVRDHDDDIYDYDDHDDDIHDHDDKKATYQLAFAQHSADCPVPQASSQERDQWKGPDCLVHSL